MTTPPPQGPPSRPLVDLSERARAVEQIEARGQAGALWTLAHLRWCVIALGGAGVVLGVLAGLTAGGRAVAGVALGTVIVGVFFGVSAVVLALVARRAPRALMLVALTSYVVKVVALGVVLVLLPRDGVIDTRWMAGSVAVGVFVWLGAHLRQVVTTKIFYVNPEGPG